MLALSLYQSCLLCPESLFFKPGKLLQLFLIDLFKVSLKDCKEGRDAWLPPWRLSTAGLVARRHILACEAVQG